MATKKIKKKIRVPANLAHAYYMDILKQPRVTEKASLKASDNVYVFEVPISAEKAIIAKAVEVVFNVVPKRIHVARIPSKRIFFRGKKGIKPGGKKAYIFLKAGDKIEVV